MAEINVKNIDDNQKAKAIFVLQTKGKNLSDAVRETVEKYATEFDSICK